MAEESIKPKATPLGTRLLAGLGFVMGALLLGLYFSQQAALDRAESYLRNRYRLNLDIPVKRVRADFLTTPIHAGRNLPPLGFCWTVELDAGNSQAEVMINPWTHDVVDWRAEL